MAQVALSFVALASAGMFLRSLGNARGIDPGFDGSRLAVLGINPGTQGFDEARTRELYRRGHRTDQRRGRRGGGDARDEPCRSSAAGSGAPCSATDRIRRTRATGA